MPVVEAHGLVGEFEERQVGLPERVCTGIDADVVTLQGVQAVDGHVGRIAIGQPQTVGVEGTEDDGADLGLDDADRLLTGDADAWGDGFVEQVEAEETVGGLPVLEQGLTGFELAGDPTVAYAAVEHLLHLVDHPEDGLAALALAEVITGGGGCGLCCCEQSPVEEGLEEREGVCLALPDHLLGGEQPIDAFSASALEGAEGGGEDL